MTVHNIYGPTSRPTETQCYLMLKAQWEADLATIKAQDRIQPWRNDDPTLDADEARLLSIIRDAWGFRTGAAIKPDLFRDYVLSDDSDVSDLTAAMSFLSDGNTRATLDKCLTKGYVTRSVCPIEHRELLQMTCDGRDALDDWEEDE